MIYQLLRETED